MSFCSWNPLFKCPGLPPCCHAKLETIVAKSMRNPLKYCINSFLLCSNSCHNCVVKCAITEIEDDLGSSKLSTCLTDLLPLYPLSRQAGRKKLKFKLVNYILPCLARHKTSKNLALILHLYAQETSRFLLGYLTPARSLQDLAHARKVRKYPFSCTDLARSCN